MKKVNVALIGYKFMGRAHSNAWRQVATFFEPPVAPELKVICGRDEAGVRDAAARFGWQEHATDWGGIRHQGHEEIRIKIKIRIRTEPALVRS